MKNRFPNFHLVKSFFLGKKLKGGGAFCIWAKIGDSWPTTDGVPRSTYTIQKCGSLTSTKEYLPLFPPPPPSALGHGRGADTINSTLDTSPKSPQQAPLTVPPFLGSPVGRTKRQLVYQKPAW